MPVKVECLVERHRPMPRIQTTEDGRLEEARQRQKHWKRWGPYLSERQWVRCVGASGPAERPGRNFRNTIAGCGAYLWGKDVLAGISTRHQQFGSEFAF